MAPVVAVLEVPRLDPGAGASGEPAAEEGEVRFRRVPATVGARWAVSVRAESRTSDPQAGEQVSAYSSEYTVRVLSVEKGAAASVALTFDVNAHAFQGHARPTVIHGRSYVVDALAPNVRDASGAPASEEESQRVRDVFPDLGTRARIDEVLPDGAMRLGERRDDVAAAVLRVVHPRAWTLRAGTAVLARVEGEHAVFTLSLDASSDGGVRMNVEGDARVRIRDARLTSISLEGSYEHGDGTTGTITIRRTVADL